VFCLFLVVLKYYQRLILIFLEYYLKKKVQKIYKMLLASVDMAMNTCLCVFIFVCAFDNKHIYKCGVRWGKNTQSNHKMYFFGYLNVIVIHTHTHIHRQSINTPTHRQTAGTHMFFGQYKAYAAYDGPKSSPTKAVAAKVRLT